MSSREPLSNDRVVRAAIDYADAHGIEALSMRRLAKELGVEAMSLYNHVANKDEILEAMADAVMAEIELPEDVSDWKAAIRTSAISHRDALLRHPWAAGLAGSRRSGGPAHIAHSDWTLRTLREAGLAPALLYHAYHVLGAYVLGFAVQELNFDIAPGELKGMAENFLAELPTGAYPDFVEHVRQHIDPPEDEGGFVLGLNLILDALGQKSK